MEEQLLNFCVCVCIKWTEAQKLILHKNLEVCPFLQWQNCFWVGSSPVNNPADTQTNTADSCGHWLKGTWPGQEAELQGKPADTLRFMCLGAWECWIMDHLSQDRAMQASRHSWLRKSPLTKKKMALRSNIFSQQQPQEAFGICSRGTQHEVNMDLQIEKTIWGDICSSSHILQTLYQILLLKGNFNRVGPLTLWHTTGDNTGQIRLQSGPGWVCTCAPQNTLAVSKLTISSFNSPLYVFQSSTTLPFSPD